MVHLRHGLRAAPRGPIITEIMSCHARTDDEDPFVSETFERLTHAVVDVFVLVVE